MVHHEAVDGAAPGGVDDVPLVRPTLGAHRAGRVPQRAALRAALDEEPVLPRALEPERIVLGQRGPRPQRPPFLLLFRSFAAGGSTGARLELEDAEPHGRDELAVVG